MESDDEQSTAVRQRQRLHMGITRWLSKNVNDGLFSLVHWWTERRKMKHRDLGRDKACVLMKGLKKLLEEIPLPAFDKTDHAGRTVLHLALLHEMPEQFILVLVENMQKSELDLEDSKRNRAVDYLLDWEDVSDKVLQALIAQGVHLSEKRKCSIFKHPLPRLCRRTVDGCQLLKLVGRLSVSKDFKSKMLEEAVKRGSSSTVEYLLKTGADVRYFTRWLLYDAVEANHDSLDKVRLLTHNADLSPAQLNDKGMSLLSVAAGGKPPKIDLLVLALREGVNANQEDTNGDTALHKVTKNYSERTIPWKESEQALEILLRHPGIRPNIQNSQGLTPLRILSGPDFAGGGFERALAAISRRRDGHIIIKRLIETVGVDGLQDYAKYMLEAAVEDGLAATVEVLLDKMHAAADGIEDHGRLLMIAARSNTEADLKLRRLYEKGADCKYTDARGFSVLHAIAQSATATEKILRTCTSTLKLGLDLNDKYGNTPLHIAAKSTHSCSDLLFGKLSDRQGDPNALNNSKESPLRLVLRYNHSNMELRRNKVALLLMNGCIPTEEDFYEYEGDADDFKDLFLSKGVIVKIQEPFQVFLSLAKYCKERVEEEKFKLSRTLSWTQSFQWTNVDAYEIENAAFKGEVRQKST